jgi:hypothetical protein
MSLESLITRVIPPVPTSILTHTLPVDGTVLDLVNARRIDASCMNPCCIPVLLREPPTLVSEDGLLAFCQTTPYPHVDLVRRCWEAQKASNEQFDFLSVEIRHGGQYIRLPLWFFSYWDLMNRRQAEISFWTEQELVRQPEHHWVFSKIPWWCPSGYPYYLEELVEFLRPDWLSRGALDNLAITANKMMARDLLGRFNHFAGSDTARRLIDDYRYSEPSQLRADRWPGTLREKLKTGEYKRLGLLFFVNQSLGLTPKQDDGNHWIGVVIDGETKKILLGDSLRGTPTEGVISVVRRWLGLSFGSDTHFIQTSLHSRYQPDFWSCGDHAFTMVAHHLAPSLFPPLSAGLESLVYRKTLLEKILEYMHV